MDAYMQAHGNYKIPGAGWNATGEGWVSLEDVSQLYTTSIVHALYNGNFLKTVTLDDPVKKPGYMLYLCGTNKEKYALYATLDAPSSNDTAKFNASCSGTGAAAYVAAFGKNYVVENQ